MLRLICFVGAILLWASAPVFAEEPLDLQQAINRAIGYNRELLRSGLASDSAKLGITAAGADFQVRVRPEASLGFAQGLGTRGYGLDVSKKLIWGTEFIAGGHESSDPTTGLYQDSIRLEVQQPIFRNFGELIHGETLLLAGNSLKSTRRSQEMRKADLILKVVESYQNILRIEHQVRSSRESVKRMEALHRITRSKEILGRTTRVDTLRVELLRGLALSRLEGGMENLTLTRRDFAELLGFSPDKVFQLNSPPSVTFIASPPEETVRAALENRLDYAQALQDYGDAERGVRIAQRKLLPDMSVVARREWFGTGLSASEARDLRENIWFVGLSVNTDFNITRERTAYQQAQITQNSFLQAIDILKVSIDQQVNRALLAYHRVQSELKISERNFWLADSRSRLSRRLFELGRVDNFSVTDAEEAYLQAENQLLSVQAEAFLSIYRLFHVSGTLIDAPRELKANPLTRFQ